MPDAAPSSVASSVGADPSAVATPAAGTTGSPPAVVASDVAKPTEGASAAKFKVKVDGKEMEVTQEELVKGYQLEASSRKRGQEAAEAKKSADALVAAAKAGDYEALVKAGLSDAEIEQLSINVLSKKHQAILEDERRKSLDPAQRETEDKLRELDGLKAEKKKQEESAHAQRVGAAKQQLSKAVIDTMQEFPEAIRRNEALAQNVFEAWAFCTQHPDEAKEMGIEVSPKGIYKALRLRHLDLAAAMLASASDEEREKLIPESVAASRLARAKAAAEKAAHPSLTSAPQVRGAAKSNETPRKSQGAKLRELTLGSLGIK